MNFKDELEQHKVGIILVGSVGLVLLILFFCGMRRRNKVAPPPLDSIITAN